MVNTNRYAEHTLVIRYARADSEEVLSGWGSATPLRFSAADELQTFSSPLLFPLYFVGNGLTAGRTPIGRGFRQMCVVPLRFSYTLTTAATQPLKRWAGSMLMVTCPLCSGSVPFRSIHASLMGVPRYALVIYIRYAFRTIFEKQKKKRGAWSGVQQPPVR